MKKTLTIAAAIVIAGAMLPISVSRLKSFERTVDVKGLCEKEVMADKVIWPLTYKVVGDELSPVLSEIESNNSAIVRFLKAGGIEDAEITISTPAISDKYASEYGSNDRVFRYLATCTITVCTDKIDRMLSLQASQSDLLRSGITFSSDWGTEPQFKFEALNDIKPEMIAEATANARQAADKFAKDSDSRIGKIKTAGQGTFSIEDRDSNTPQIKRVRVVTYVTYYLKN